MEARKRFADASTSGGNDRPELKMDQLMLTTFLETCMKLLHDIKAVRGLQELINRCVGTASGEMCVVRKLRKHTTRMGMEIRLTT